MTLYVESSALLAVVFGEPAAERVRAVMGAAEALVTSELTLIECDRALHRALALEKLTEADAAERRGLVSQTTAAWLVLEISGPIVERARQPFAPEPVRTLDALHLASALLARSATTGLELLTLDDRVRAAAKMLGLPLQPAPARSDLG